MKKNGFTLVELIITILIMGIIMIVAFPSVTKLGQTNKYKKAVSYGESMVESAKLYVEQHQEDMWGGLGNAGEKKVGITDLKSTDLLKEYTDKKDKCDIGEVKVTRTGSKDNFSYSYAYTLTCTLNSKQVTCTGDSMTSECKEGTKTVYNSNG